MKSYTFLKLFNLTINTYILVQEHKTDAAIFVSTNYTEHMTNRRHL
jgi:hypothetical protein